MSKPKSQRKVIIQRTKGRGDPPQRKVSSLRRYVLKYLIFLFLIVATFTVFWPVRNHEFLNYDDNEYVTENPEVQRGLTLKGLIWAFTTTHAANWHPLTWLSHMVDCEVYGLHPGGHHLTSLFFHIANTLLLFFILHRMTMGLWASGFVAALFALHPLHVESVVWVAERKDVLSTFFWILTMWTYIGYVERPGLIRYLLVLLSFALGLLSKPMLVTLPFVMLLLDYWPLGRFQFGQPSGHYSSNTHKSRDTRDQSSVALRLILEKIPFFAFAAISGFLTIFAQKGGGAIRPLEVLPLETRIANGLVSYVSYIVKMIWPHHLAVLYPYPDMLLMWQVAGAGLLLMPVSILVICTARKHPYLAMGWLWYLGTLVPVIGLVQVGSQAMADRYTYVPLIGLFIMIAWGVQEILLGWRYRRVVLPISAGLLLSILMIVTRLQVQHWRNDITLFNHALNVTANNFLGHNNLGVALMRQSKIQEAIAHYNEALRIAPNYFNAHYNLGIILAGQGKIEEAIDHYTKALQVMPDYAEAHNDLAVALERQGKIEEAIAHYTEALRIDPDYANAHYNLGITLAEQGKIEGAVFHYTEAFRIAPDFAEAHYNLGIALSGQGKIQEAIAHYAEALRIKPHYAMAHNNMGVALLGRGKIQEGIDHFAKAVRLKPDYAEAHINLGLAYLMIGNKSSALEEYNILKTINTDLANNLYYKIFK